MRERAETRIIMALAGPEGERMVDLEASRSRRRIGASQSIWQSFSVEARSRLRRNSPGYRFGPAISFPACLGGPPSLPWPMPCLSGARFPRERRAGSCATRFAAQLEGRADPD